MKCTDQPKIESAKCRQRLRRRKKSLFHSKMTPQRIERRKKRFFSEKKVSKFFFFFGYILLVTIIMEIPVDVVTTAGRHTFIAFHFAVEQWKPYPFAPQLLYNLVSFFSGTKIYQYFWTVSLILLSFSFQCTFIKFYLCPHTPSGTNVKFYIRMLCV